MNKWMKICTFVFISANLFQTAVFAQGNSPFRRGWEQLPADQRDEIERLRAREQQNPQDEQGNVQMWQDYNEGWNDSSNYDNQ